LRPHEKPHQGTISSHAKLAHEIVHALALAQVISQIPRMLNWADCSAVERFEGKVSGAWLFKGTRVPVKALFENLEGGATLEEFLAWFPGVTRDQVEKVLEYAQKSLVEA
jgi:uncharacterized protein (DUF433 family)